MVWCLEGVIVGLSLLDISEKKSKSIPLLEARSREEGREASIPFPLTSPRASRSSPAVSSAACASFGRCSSTTEAAIVIGKSAALSSSSTGASGGVGVEVDKAILWLSRFQRLRIEQLFDVRVSQNFSARKAFKTRF